VKHKICVLGKQQWNAVNAFFKYETKCRLQRRPNFETLKTEIRQQEKNISVKQLFKVMSLRANANP